MIKLVYLFSVILLLSINLIAQRELDMRPGIHDRIDQLEKIKLIETLQMDEETTLKFFARRSEFKNEMEEIHKNIDDKLDKLEKAVNSNNVKDEELKSLIGELNQLHKQLDINKEQFTNSLTDILTYTQIANLVLFERKFKEELRKAIFKDKRMKRRQ